MPSSIFNGSAVKILKSILRFKDNNEIVSTTVDPIVSGFVSPTGSMLLKSDGKTFKKFAAPDTSWTEIPCPCKITVMYPLAGQTRTFSTLQAAFNSIPAATTATNARQVYTVFIPSGTYDESLSIEINNRRIVVYCRGTVNLGALSGASWGAGGTVRNLTVTNNGTALIDSIRSALVITSENPLVEGLTTQQAYLSKFRVSGNVSLATTVSATGEFHLEMEVFGNFNCNDYTGVCNIYLKNSRFRGTFGDGIARILNANRVTFDGAVSVNSYSGIENCTFLAGLTTATATTAIFPSGMINCNFSGTFTGPVSSAKMDNTTNYWFTTNGATLAGGATKVIFENYATTTRDGIIASSDYSKFAAVNDLDSYGLVSWSGSGAYYSLVAGVFTLLRGGTGRIDSTPVTFLASDGSTQKISSWTANATHFLYIDSNGLLQSTTNATISLNYVRLFAVLYDGTNYQVVREDHPYNFESPISNYLHDNVGAVIQSVPGSGTPAILADITRVATGTGGAAGDRELKIVGAAVLADHGLSTTIPDSGGAAITINWYYTNAAGKWIRYAQQSQAPMVYNNAGTITALTTGPNNDVGYFTIYVSKDDLNTSTPTYFATIHTSVYSTNSSAQTAINAGVNSLATNELYYLELAQLGTIIVQNNVSGGYIETVNVSKSTLRSVITTGGGTGSASTVNTNVANFDSWLSSIDLNVQAALETLDDRGKDSNFKIQNSASPTKIFNFSAASITAGNTSTLTVPDRSLTLDNITTATTTNLTGFMKGNAANVSVVTSVPAVDTSINVSNFNIWLSASNTTLQSSLETLDDVGKDANFKIHNTTDITKIAKFSASPIAPGTTRTVTIPDRNLTLDNITTATTTNLSGYLTGNSSNVVVQTTVPSTDVALTTSAFDGYLDSSETNLQLALNILDNIAKDGTFKLLNTSSLTKIAKFSCASITAGQTRTVTFPDRNLTLDNISATTTTAGTGFLAGNGTNVVSYDILPLPNYATNGNLNYSTDGFATYADTPAIIPQNGTGGTPTITFTLNNTTPLRGAGDGVITKGATDCQGQGVNYFFTIAEADINKEFFVSFDYSWSSNFDIVNSDIRMFMYATTNATFESLSPIKLNDTGRYIGYFRTTVSPYVNHRLIFHIATTNALAWTFNIDNLQIGPLLPGTEKANFRADRNGVNQTGVNPNGSFIKMLFNSISSASAFDFSGQYSPTTSKYIINSPGVWHFDARIQTLTPNVLNSVYELALYRNGSLDTSGGRVTPAVSSTLVLTLSVDVNCDNNDEIEIYLYGAGNNSAITLTIDGIIASSWFSGFLT